MADFEFTLTSNRELIESATAEAIQTALEAVGTQAVAHAVAEITAQGAVDTGRLRNSITKAVEDQTVYVGTNVEYAPYVEFGTGIYVSGGRQTPWSYQDSKGNWHKTRGMKPRPFLRPAFEKNLDEFKAIFESILAKIGK